MGDNSKNSTSSETAADAAAGSSTDKKKKTTREQVIIESLKESSLQKAQAGRWLRAFTRFHKVPVFKRVWLYLLFMAVYTYLIDAFVNKDFIHTLAKESGAIAFSSIVMGVLLVFRTETAYGAWLDGRRLWGQLMTESRVFCFKLRSIATLPELERMRMGELIISFSYALKHHLRETTPSEPLPGIDRNAYKNTPNFPIHVAEKILTMMNGWHKDKYISETNLEQMVDQNLKALTDICGNCERIKTSQMTVSYRAFMRQGIVMNLAVCPWVLATEYSLLLCLPMILIGSYFLVGLELIAEEIEEPFGKDLDDIPLDSLCGNIRTAVTDILGLQRLLKYTQTVEAPIPDLLS